MLENGTLTEISKETPKLISIVRRKQDNEREHSHIVSLSYQQCGRWHRRTRRPSGGFLGPVDWAATKTSSRLHSKTFVAGVS